VGGNKKQTYEAVAIGVSAGGLSALTFILETLPADFPLPIIVVQHRVRDERTLLEEVLQTKCKIFIKQADEKEQIRGGIVYLAPPDYHLLIETDHTFSLAYDAPVNYSRPSIDVLFETAASAYQDKLIAIILTGANHDGAEGIKKVKEHGGLTIAQNPKTAAFPFMPQAAIDREGIQLIYDLNEIKDFLLNIRSNI
jgi:two-component system chemotaxis response regulator CheB